MESAPMVKYLKSTSYPIKTVLTPTVSRPNSPQNSTTNPQKIFTSLNTFMTIEVNFVFCMVQTNRSSYIHSCPMKSVNMAPVQSVEAKSKHNQIGKTQCQAELQPRKLDGTARDATQVNRRRTLFKLN